MDEPEHIITDFAKFERPGQLHIAYQALHEYAKKNGSLPKPRNAADADAFVAVAKEVNEASKAKQEEMDEGLMKNVSHNAVGDVIPMQAVIGGISAQEVMKVRG